MTALFSPHQALAVSLLAHLPDDTDGAHDLAHLARVWRNVQRIAAEEGGDRELLLAATVLHDGVHVAKNDQRRAQASMLAAEQAREILAGMGWRLSVTRCWKRLARPVSDALYGADGEAF